jgi:hypothetical protein
VTDSPKAQQATATPYRIRLPCRSPRTKSLFERHDSTPFSDTILRFIGQIIAALRKFTAPLRVYFLLAARRKKRSHERDRHPVREWNSKGWELERMCILSVVIWTILACVGSTSGEFTVLQPQKRYVPWAEHMYTKIFLSPWRTEYNAARCIKWRAIKQGHTPRSASRGTFQALPFMSGSPSDFPSNTS